MTGDTFWNTVLPLLIMVILCAAAYGVLLVALDFYRIRALCRHLFDLVGQANTATRHQLDQVATIKAEIRRILTPPFMPKDVRAEYQQFIARSDGLCDQTTQAILHREDPEWAKRTLVHEAGVRIMERAQTIAQDVAKAVKTETIYAQRKRAEYRQEQVDKLLLILRENHKALLLVQEELRKNPAFADLFARLESFNELLIGFLHTLGNQDAEGIDPDKLAEVLQDLLLRQLKQSK